MWHWTVIQSIEKTSKDRVKKLSTTAGFRNALNTVKKALKNRHSEGDLNYMHYSDMTKFNNNNSYNFNQTKEKNYYRSLHTSSIRHLNNGNDIPYYANVDKKLKAERSMMENLTSYKMNKTGNMIVKN